MKKKISIVMMILIISNLLSFSVMADEQKFKWIIKPQFAFEDVGCMDLYLETSLEGISLISLGRTPELTAGLVYVKQNGKYGVIDYSGKKIVEASHNQKPYLCNRVRAGKFVIGDQEYDINGSALGAFINVYDIKR